MIRKLSLFFIRLYWWTLSPIIGSVCRFQPSYSRYTAVCIDRFGAVRGGWMGFVRICKCQPFHPGGYDPPPRRPGDESPYEARIGGHGAASRIVLPGLSGTASTPSSAPATPASSDDAEKNGDGVHSSQVSSNLAPASVGAPASGTAGRA